VEYGAVFHICSLLAEWQSFNTYKYIKPCISTGRVTVNIQWHNWRGAGGKYPLAAQMWAPLEMGPP